MAGATKSESTTLGDWLLSPTSTSGALMGGTIGAYTGGPFGALAGVVIGGATGAAYGYVIDHYVGKPQTFEDLRPREGAGSDGSTHE